MQVTETRRDVDDWVGSGLRSDTGVEGGVRTGDVFVMGAVHCLYISGVLQTADGNPRLAYFVVVGVGGHFLESEGKAKDREVAGLIGLYRKADGCRRSPSLLLC